MSVLTQSAEQFFRRSFPFTDGRDATPLAVFAAWLQVGRAPLAFVVAFLAVDAVLVFPELSTSWRTASIGIVAGLFAITAVGVVRSLRWVSQTGRPPSALRLSLAGALDLTWVVLGWLATGLAPMPFPPLVPLVLASYGILLSVGPIVALTLFGGVIVGATHGFGVPLKDAGFSAEAQIALLLGVGGVAAVLGNRVRHSLATVRRLSGALGQFAEHHGAVLQHLPMGVVVLDQDLSLQRANPLARSLFGDRLPAALDRLVNLSAAIRSALAGESQAGGEDRYATADGERLIEWRVVARDVLELEGDERRSPELDAARIVVLLEDVTEARRVEAVRRRAQHYEQIAELSAGLAHEVRNPLAALRSSAEQLEESESTDPMDRRLAAVVVREADRLDRLVGEFLDFARVGGGTRGRHRIDGVVRDAVQVATEGVARERGVEFQSDLEPVELDTDADLLFRIVSNLCLNAAAFAPHGSRVDLSLGRTDGTVELRVRDRGPGVPPEDRERIFRPFVTTRAGGSGLGLAIAARSASLLGGDLTAETPEGEPDTGRGIVFRLQLPVS